MINTLLQAFLNIVIYTISVILSPIDTALSTALPDLSNLFTSVGNFITYMCSALGWVISLTGLSSTVISIIVIYYTFKLTMPLIVYFIKLAVQWYDKLKP